jgi:hypothetical protein
MSSIFNLIAKDLQALTVERMAADVVVIDDLKTRYMYPAFSIHLADITT